MKVQYTGSHPTTFPTLSALVDMPLEPGDVFEINVDEIDPEYPPEWATRDPHLDLSVVPDDTPVTRTKTEPALVAEEEPPEAVPAPPEDTEQPPGADAQPGGGESTEGHEEAQEPKE